MTHLYLTTSKPHTVPDPPVIRFNQYATAKLDFMIDNFDHEVGGFLISSSKDPLEVIDFILVKQRASAASFEFDDDGLTDFYHDMAKAKIAPWRCLRLWAHTHPIMSANPSGVDENIFATKFLNKKVPGCNQPWAGMFIRSKTSENYFRLAYNLPDTPLFQVICEVAIDTSLPFQASDPDKWMKEVKSLVSVRTIAYATPSKEFQKYATMDIGIPDKPQSQLLDEYDFSDDDLIIPTSKTLNRYERDITILNKDNHASYAEEEEVVTIVEEKCPTDSKGKKISSPAKSSSKKE